MMSQCLSIKQLSEYLNIPVPTLYDWVHQRKIPYYKYGKMLRFDVYEIEQWRSVFRVKPKKECS